MSAGDDRTKSILERKTKRGLKRPYTPYAHVTAKRIKLEANVEPKLDENVLDFLKTRPQIASLEKSAVRGRTVAEIRSGRTANGEEVADLIYSDRFVSFCL